MVDRIYGFDQPVVPLKPAGADRAGGISHPAKEVEGKAFKDVLTEAIGKPRQVEFSAHAGRRLASRGIEVDPGQMERLGRALDRIEAKGGRNSLVILDGLSLIVNVPSRTVVTAIELDGMADRVITNIDSAAIG